MHKKSLKLVLILIVLLVLSLTVYTKGANEINISDDIYILGAQVRTIEPNGLAFVAKVDGSLLQEEITEYGILLARGKISEDDYDSFIINSQQNGYTVINGSTTEINFDNSYRITLIAIPEHYYNLEFTARSYIKLTDGTYIYSSEPKIRSYYQVAKAAVDDGDDTEIITNICKTRIVYNLNGGSWNNTSIQKTYDTFSALTDDLLTDYNDFVNDELTKISIGSLDVNDARIDEVCNFFYSSQYGKKWKWLIDYLSTKSLENTIPAFTTFLTVDSTSVLKGINSNYPKAIAYEIRGLISETNYATSTSYPSSDYTNQDIKETLLSYNKDNQKTLFIYDDAQLILPTLKKDHYNFEGWNDGNDFITSVPKDAGVINLNASFTPINYNINYIIEGGNLNSTSYNIESNDIQLPTEIISTAGTFIGWYLNSNFTGEALTYIPSGTTGDITLYAKLQKELKPISVTNGSTTTYYNSLAEVVIAKNDIINIDPGTYSGNIQLSSTATGVIINGPNKDLDGNDLNRSDEAYFTGTLTIAIKGVEINGIAFKETGRIKINRENVTLKSIKMTCNQGTGDLISITEDVLGPKITNCSLETTLPINCIFYYSVQYYLWGITITNNYFKGPIWNTEHGTAIFKAIYINRLADTSSINHNKFEGFAKAIDLCESSNDMTKIDIINNEFSGCGNTYDQPKSSPVSIQKITNGLTTTISYNTFKNSNCLNLKDSPIIRLDGTIGNMKCLVKFNRFMDVEPEGKALVYLSSMSGSNTTNNNFTVDSNYFASEANSDRVKTTQTITNTFSNPEDVPTYTG